MVLFKALASTLSWRWRQITADVLDKPVNESVLLIIENERLEPVLYKTAIRFALNPDSTVKSEVITPFVLCGYKRAHREEKRTS